jgi:signal transduction histidine kinase
MDKYENFADVKDSIDFYFDIVDNTNLNDSVKSSFNLKAYNLIKKIKNDSLRFKYTFKSGARFFNLKSLKEYKNLSNDVILSSISTRDTLTEAKGYIYLGDYYLVTNKYDSAFYYYDRAEVKYISNGNTTKISRARLNKATVQYYKKDYIGCETTILKALPFLLKEADSELLYNAYNTLGLCRIETQEFQEALEYFNKSLNYVDQFVVDSGAKEMSLNNIGFAYLKKKEYSKAIEYFNQLSNENAKEKFPKIYIDAVLNLAYSKYKLGDVRDFEKNMNEVIKGYNELNISNVLPKIYLSEFYESQNSHEKAKEVALDAYNTSIKENTFRDKLPALKQLAKVFPEDASKFTNEYIKLNDSIVAIDKKIQNTFARIEYRVDELNNKNLLLEQKNKLTIYYALIIGLVVVMFFVYRWQKQKQREFVLVQEQQKANEEVYNMIINQQNEMDYVKEQEQHRISRELHDGVLGKLFGVRMNLDILNNDSQASTSDRQNYINEIIQVEKQIRQISHELSDETRSIINNYQLMIDKLVNDQKSILGKIINYEVDSKVPWDKFSAQEKINLYRIIQETFQNINKYSKAKKVDFFIKFVKNKLEINILDDGIGFDVRKIAKGIGIKNMMERAKLINAIYKINSEINKGTQTNIVLEITPNKE